MIKFFVLIFAFAGLISCGSGSTDSATNVPTEDADSTTVVVDTTAVTPEAVEVDSVTTE